MTREEAIKFAEHAVNMTDIPEVKEFYRMSAAALRPVSRERVEKVWRGEWELVRRMAASIECKCPKCQRTVIFTGKPANFCEKCGSANTDEAVQMVIERMEALHENRD